MSRGAVVLTVKRSGCFAYYLLELLISKPLVTSGFSEAPAGETHSEASRYCEEEEEEFHRAPSCRDFSRASIVTEAVWDPSAQSHLDAIASVDIM